MRIGDYETTRLLGKGGMSEVYEAENIRIGSRHAVKIYTYPREDESVRSRFETEGRLLARLDHPRIVKVTDFGIEEHTGRPYFAMTLVTDAEGVSRTLADAAEDGVDEETLGRWYDDIRDGLAYIHARGIVHRDLKLQNVLVGPDGHAVLTDFGISRVFAPEGADRQIVNPVDTIVRMQDGKAPVMGSIGYMAPELEMGVEATPASDWYGLGVLVYKLLTGTWCDARTDLAGALDTFDPVWMRILPKLLHANPEGRACLSYAGEKELLREQDALQAEDMRLWKRKRRAWIRWTAISFLGLSIVPCALAVRAYRAVVTERDAAYRLLALPDFESIFAIPAEAGEKEQGDMPSVTQFRAALVDAHVLTQSIFADLKDGKIDKRGLRAELGRLRRIVRLGGKGLFAGLPKTYHPSGENRALFILFEKAALEVK